MINKLTDEELTKLHDRTADLGEELVLHIVKRCEEEFGEGDKGVNELYILAVLAHIKNWLYQYKSFKMTNEANNTGQN